MGTGVDVGLPAGEEKIGLPETGNHVGVLDREDEFGLPGRRQEVVAQEVNKGDGASDGPYASRGTGPGEVADRDPSGTAASGGGAGPGEVANGCADRTTPTVSST